jgi:glycerol kinase
MRIGAIDQGTTSTRIVMADGGSVRVAGNYRHRTTFPESGWVEQDAGEILGNIRRLIAEAGSFDGLGLANQGESCLAWDAATGEPLTPAIVWQDSRSAADLAAFGPGVAARVTSLSGVPLDPYFSASKLGWIMRNVPAAAEARRRGTLRLGTTDAFYLDRLTGTFATDRATASRTSLMNLASGAWDAELCEIFGVPIECLPPIRSNIGDFGCVAGIPLLASIVDQQAALYGHGCRETGDLKITFGTGAFALAISDGAVSVETARGLLPTVAWDIDGAIRYAIDGGVYDVGSAVDWAIGAGIATDHTDFQSFEGPSAISRGLVFVPAFSGLAAPYWDRTAAPAILGLGPETTRRDLCRALLEGIALSTAGVVVVMGEVIGLNDTISIDGGVSRSPYFVQFLADCLGRCVRVRGLAEQTALGVALLVAKGLGVSIRIPEGDDRIVQPMSRLPDGARDRFEEAVARSRGWRQG